jgi:flagellar biosynthesis/type III secretory pathway M-ring protein FliF/YscJ
MQNQSLNMVQETFDLIYKITPLFLAIVGIIWKQITANFEIKRLKEQQLAVRQKFNRLDDKLDELEKSVFMAMKENNGMHEEHYKDLREAITELVKSTTEIATTLKFTTKQS